MVFDKTRLVDCCIIKPPKSEVKKVLSSDDRVSFVPMRNLGINRKSLLLEDDRKLSDVSGSYTYFAENDVLLAKITPCFENGKLGIATGLTNRIGFGSSEFIVFRSKGSVDPHYLYYYLSQPSFRESGQPVMTGAVGHKRVPKEFIENTEIPLPPIPEQKRIVAILDQVFADIEQARAKTEQNLKNARELFESYLQQVFSQRGEGWVEKPISELGLVQTGNTPKTSDKDNYGDFIPFIKPGHFLDGGSLNMTIGGLSEQGKKQSRVIPRDSVLMVCIGATIGKCGFSETEITCNQQINTLTPIDELHYRFAYYQMLTLGFQSKVIKLSGQATLPIINKKKWSSLPLAYPCIEKQFEFIERLNMLKAKTLELEEVYRNKLNELKALKKSILQKAFTGELTNTESKGVAA